MPNGLDFGVHFTCSLFSVQNTTCPCMRRILNRWKGKIEPRMPKLSQPIMMIPMGWISHAKAREICALDRQKTVLFNEHDPLSYNRCVVYFLKVLGSTLIRQTRFEGTRSMTNHRSHASIFDGSLPLYLGNIMIQFSNSDGSSKTIALQFRLFLKARKSHAIVNPFYSELTRHRFLWGINRLDDGLSAGDIYRHILAYG